MGLDVFFHESHRTLTSGSRWLNGKFRRRACLRGRFLPGAGMGPIAAEVSRGFAVVFLRCLTDFVRMSDHVYKMLELVGSSPTGIEDAVQNALARASQTIRNMRWFEVTETRGYIEENKINHWQVTVKIGFTLES
jgi:flavin-binding protein dodecin